MIWKIKYSESAKADIISIFEYISYELASPKAAVLLICFRKIPLVMCCAEPDDADEEETC